MKVNVSSNENYLFLMVGRFVDFIELCNELASTKKVVVRPFDVDVQPTITLWQDLAHVHW